MNTQTLDMNQEHGWVKAVYERKNHVEAVWRMLREGQRSKKQLVRDMKPHLTEAKVEAALAELLKRKGAFFNQERHVYCAVPPRFK